MQEQDNRLGEAIRLARIRKGYTQEYLAERLDITPGHLQHMESGRRKPSLPMLFQMMELLGFSVDALVYAPQEDAPCVSLAGLSGEEAEAVTRLVEAIKKDR